MDTDKKKRKKIRSWDGAFRELVPAVRQQSVRVADYTRVIFERACAEPYYTKGRDKVEYMTLEYVDVAYKCGLYHQIGKALLPQEHQLWREDFTAPEKELYYTYTTEGKKLVTRLQGWWEEDDEEDIDTASQMIRLACEQHMENWNGSGYPLGYAGESISTIAQIVGMAKALDELAAGTRSETPFEEAVGTLMEQQGTRFSENMIEVLKDCKNDLKTVFKKYIQYTKNIPRTIPLVDKRPERPMGLHYRPISLDDKTTGVYEAVPWFTTVQEDKPTETLEQITGVLKRTGLLCDAVMYLLYEAADAIIRMRHCGYETNEILMPVPDEFYFEPNAQYRLLQLFADQPADPRRLKLTVSAEFLKDAELSEIDRLKEFAKQGYALVLDEYHPDWVPMEQIQEIGFAGVRISQEISDWYIRNGITQELKQYGISIAEHCSTEELLSEEKLIHDLLASEQS